MKESTGQPSHQCLQAWHMLRALHEEVELQLAIRLHECCGLTPSELDVLARIFDVSIAVRPGDLCEQVSLSQPAISRMIDRFETRGLVEKRVDPLDRRAVQVSLTASGRELTELALETHAVTVRTVMGGRLSDNQQRALANLFEEPQSDYTGG